jgi:pSer/pThr/pTyr-binding forkhead associated (FHA) protein
VEEKEILIQALKLGRERFLEQFPDPLFVGDMAFEKAPSALQQQTVPSKEEPELFPTHVVLTIPALRRDVQNRFTIGRAVDSDIVIVHETVSSTHAWLTRAPDGSSWDLSDAGSRNGTWAGQERLSAPGQSVELRPGMRLRFGDVALTVIESGAFWDRLRRVSPAR